jgi:iron(III) transport system ATP-binding protein
MGQNTHTATAEGGMKQEKGSQGYLIVDHITKTFGKIHAADDVTFSVGKGEMVTLLGPSGCGKSTTLRCVAGLETIDAGQIIMDGELVSSAKEHISIPPERRDIGMVFQSYAVWPHMTVWGNVAYPLQVHKVPKEEVDSRVRQMLSLVGLAEMVDRNVTKLSGGQQQRVVLARALVHNPRMLLFDEPLSNLDARLRVSMRFEIRQLQQRVGVSALYVTHDQTEAMVLSDRVIVMNQGRIEQVGPPLEIYRKPVSSFVASFFGEVNFVEGTVASLEPTGQHVPVEVQAHGKTQLLSAFPQPGMKAGDRVYVSIRPQDIEVVPESAEVGATPAMRGKVSRIVHMGSHVEYCIDVGELQLNCHCVHDLNSSVGTAVKVVLRPERCICVSR